MKYFSLELLFIRKRKEKEQEEEEETCSALNIVFLHEGPHKGAGLIQREEEEHMRYEEKEEGIETMLSHILVFVLSLSQHCP